MSSYNEARDLQFNDRPAEMAVLACCLQASTARERAQGIMSGADFFQPQLEEVWDAMIRLDRQGMAVAPVSLLGVVRHKTDLARIVTDLVTYPVVADDVDTYARTVRMWATKRRMWDETERLRQEIFRPNVDVIGLAASTANRFAAVRDAGATTDDIEAMTAEELMLEVDDEPDWIIPGFLERADRFLITGAEGGGKSHWARQIVILASVGLDPFRPWKRINPVRAMLMDFENSKRQLRRRVAGTYAFAANKGQVEPRYNVLCMPRSDITADRVLSRLHRELDACQPDLLYIGPLYKLSPKALQTDDEAGPVLAALDTIRDRGIALVIEAHAGHAMSGRKRDLRPRGSSALMGWPEFGYGMERVGESQAVLTPWRGDRDIRDFPLSLKENGWGWEEARHTTIQDVWRPKQDWSNLERDEE